MKPVRCAIYTRKSSEEGLEQGFNSLDAQREACAAYVLSQASEGWVEVRERYDDGGLSGGTLERPALQRLLSDLAAGKLDIIVVYKVDRLTRSLLDFARLVEAFDAAGVSFVSITQSFNTTTSMGRLTLNMLLSFAQFEREVTAERIRDKIAASKAKGMWMGGTPPLGYEPKGRTLRVVEEHAALVREIYDRYLELGNVRSLADLLRRQGVYLPVRRRMTTSNTIGGGAFSRGQLYKVLSNRVYLGEIVHKDRAYRGQHPAIIDRDTWDKVQASLAANSQGDRSRARAEQPSLLAGKVVDENGEPLVATHACKGKTRYRYYVSQGLQAGTSDTGMRVPAREIEGVVAGLLARAFDDGVELVATAWLQVPASDYADVVARAAEIATRVRRHERGLVEALVEQVRVERGRVEITCSHGSIAEAVGVEAHPEAAPLVLSSEVQLARSGRAMRLVDTAGVAPTREPNASLTRLVARANRLWNRLREEGLDVTRLAEREGMTPAYATRVLRLAFLAPPVVQAILAGTHSPRLTAGQLTSAGAIAADWSAQSALLTG